MIVVVVALSMLGAWACWEAWYWRSAYVRCADELADQGDYRGLEEDDEC